METSALPRRIGLWSAIAIVIGSVIGSGIFRSPAGIADRLPGHRFLAYLQNHDQVGNRATGDRLSATVPWRRQAVGAAIVLAGAALTQVKPKRRP